MDTLVIVLLLVVIALLAVVAIVLLAARRAAQRQQASDAATLKRASGADPFASPETDAMLGDPRQLKPGDTVEVRGHAYAVRGSIHCKEGAWSWQEHLLDDATGPKLWLSVEEDPDLQLVLWTELRGLTVSPGPKTIDLDGRRYTSDESGRATYTAAGHTGLDPQGTVRYHDYEAADGTQLSFERWGDSESWEAGRGERVQRHELRVFPSSSA
ncbi:DUF4178 domain-containing protein [Longispora albida]|uniref:DUF4178 domain-containing protein n=1 Tax=Longispora albida TaxID=203523 RepID=UPI00037CB637|nr:DUF4178 domain-containing protein [Longispora albida]